MWWWVYTKTHKVFYNDPNTQVLNYDVPFVVRCFTATLLYSFLESNEMITIYGGRKNRYLLMQVNIT